MAFLYGDVVRIVEIPKVAVLVGQHCQMKKPRSSTPCHKENAVASPTPFDDSPMVETPSSRSETEKNKPEGGQLSIDEVRLGNSNSASGSLGAMATGLQSTSTTEQSRARLVHRGVVKINGKNMITCKTCPKVEETLNGQATMVERTYGPNTIKSHAKANHFKSRNHTKACCMTKWKYYAEYPKGRASFLCFLKRLWT